MHAKTVLAILSLILSTTGSLHGSLVSAFCSDSGERGVAGSPQLACSAVDCHIGPESGNLCVADECCAIEELPTPPIAQHSVSSSLAVAATAAHGLLPGKILAIGMDELSRRLSDGTSPPGPESAAFPGYPLPLLS